MIASECTETHTNTHNAERVSVEGAAVSVGFQRRPQWNVLAALARLTAFSSLICSLSLSLSLSLALSLSASTLFYPLLHTRHAAPLPSSRLALLPSYQICRCGLVVRLALRCQLVGDATAVSEVAVMCCLVCTASPPPSLRSRANFFRIAFGALLAANTSRLTDDTGGG